MNFTREPIIETVITPRDGCKLVIRSSKGANQEDYFVDAVEVVSFGHSFFFRSLERPKSFLVPISDYEILELKETRMVLKNATTERSIKIGGGRDAAPPMRPSSEEPVSAERSAERGPQQAMPSERMDRRRDNKRRRGRRGRDRSEQPFPQGEEHTSENMPEEGSFQGADSSQRESTHEREPMPEEPKVAPSFISKLFPPPPTLIKETLSRYKPAESVEEDLFPSSSEEPVAFEEKTSFEESIFEHPEVSSDENDQEDSEE